MRWTEREGHKAATCDVCGDKLPPKAWGRGTRESDYQPGGSLEGEGRRLGLLLTCGATCAIVADAPSGTETTRD